MHACFILIFSFLVWKCIDKNSFFQSYFPLKVTSHVFLKSWTRYLILCLENHSYGDFNFASVRNSDVVKHHCHNNRTHLTLSPIGCQTFLYRREPPLDFSFFFCHEIRVLLWCKSALRTWCLIRKTPIWG